MSKYIISLLFAIIFQVGYSQQYFFNNYSVKEGLLQSNATCGIQDQNGYLWIGTEGGVSKFNGIDFTNFTKENGLAESNVSSIFQDKEGVLWIGHQNGGLSYFKKGKINICSELKINKTIASITQDSEGNIWLATLGAGGIKITIDSLNQIAVKQFLGKEGLGDYIFQVYQDKERTLWFVTDVGLKNKKVHTNEFDFYKVKGMPPYQITSVLKDKDRNLWLGTYQGGVFKYNETTESLKRITVSEGLFSNWVSNLYESKDKSIWVATWGGGISRISKDVIKSYNLKSGLQDNKIRFIFEDRESNMVIGTNENGFSIFNGERFTLYNEKTGISNNQIWSVINAGDKIVIGHNKGIDIIADQEIIKIAHFEEQVRSMCHLNNDVWVGTWGGGIYKLDLKNEKLKSISKLNKSISLNINNISCDNDGNIWVSTIKGLSVFDPSTNESKSFPGIIGKVELDIAISCQGNDNMLLGTRKNGLIYYNGNAFTRICIDDILAAPTSICYDNAKNLFYVGTEGSGVYVIKDEKVIQRINRTHGLLSDFILSVQFSQKYLWVTSNKGLSKYNFSSKIIKNYEESDGFTPIEGKLNSIDFKDNKLFVGTVEGLVIYDETKDVKNSKSPLLNLANIKLNLKDTVLNENTELSYQNNSLVFEFDAISLTNPDKINYQVKLDGWDDWRYTTDKKVSYSNLPEGEYQFKLKACNNDGVWSENPLTFKFTVLPPFWRTWWFYLICIAAIIIGIIAFIKIRERQLIYEKKVLEQKVEERTEEVVEKSRELEHALGHIQSSIVYAQRIQNAILPTEQQIKEYFPDSFVFFKPRDIVSGDFYWMEISGDNILFSAIDCTGHGVPGAFVSMVGNNLLNQSVRKHGLTKPSEILDDVHREVQTTLQVSDDTSVKDGMDLALCNFNPKKMILQYAGAHNAMYLIRDNELIEYKANRFAIGYKGRDEGKQFDNVEISVQKNDVIYIFSDGFVDQFGGELGRKYMSKRFKKYLLENHKLSFSQQKEKIEIELNNWTADKYNQIDDILVWGIKF